MAKEEDRIKVINLLRGYLAELQKNNINITAAILFGSYAKGNYEKWSDIDIAIVSKDFTGRRFEDKERIRKIKSKFSYNIFPLPYRPEDFVKEDLFVNEILSTGINII